MYLKYSTAFSYLRYYAHGFTQKQPNWLHLRTNPGPQVITELPVERVEVRKLLAC